jgi:hypothetical protein
MLYANREKFTVRVPRHESSIPAGVGFIVADLHIVTCAHVVNVALGRDDERSQAMPEPDELIRVDLLTLGDKAKPVARNCRVVSIQVPRPV